MKKKIAILLALAMVLGLFAACGNSTQPSTSSAGPAADSAQSPAAVEEAPAPAEIVHLIEFPIDEPFTITVSESTTPSLTGSALIGDDGSELGWASLALTSMRNAWLVSRKSMMISGATDP